MEPPGAEIVLRPPAVEADLTRFRHRVEVSKNGIHRCLSAFATGFSRSSNDSASRRAASGVQSLGTMTVAWNPLPLVIYDLVSALLGSLPRW